MAVWASQRAVGRPGRREGPVDFARAPNVHRVGQGWVAAPTGSRKPGAHPARRPLPPMEQARPRRWSALVSRQQRSAATYPVTWALPSCA